ncbi:siderophore-interacting protein [Streptomyces sp. MT29]|nr:siderophore-interacting protein [Streptomyces sp. MT29]
MAAQRAYTTHPLVLRRVTVRSVHQVTPRMRRVVLGGEELAAFTRDGTGHPAFAAPGFDDHIKLILAADGDVHAALPAQLPHGIEWTPAEHRLTRDYTPRRVDPEAGELHLDFVVHGDGPAEAWSAAAREGDELWFVGPKSSLRLPERLDWIQLVGDETALPAIGRFLDERPLDAPALVLVTVSDESARQELALREGDTVTWVVAEPGDAEALEAAVRALPVEAGEGYVWAAAESRALLPVRRYLQRERKLPKDRLNVTGYWHREEAPAPEAEATADAAVREPAGIPSPLPWLVARAALRAVSWTRAIAGAVGRGTGDPPGRERAGDRRTAAAALLVRRGRRADDGAPGLRLGPAGEELLDEHEREEYTGHEGELLLALTHLAPALRGGGSPWRLASGGTLHEAVAQDAERYGELVEECEQLVFLLGGLTADPLWESIGTCLLTGPGSASVAAALDDAGRRPRLRVARTPYRSRPARARSRTGPDRLDGRPRRCRRRRKALAHRTDEEAALLLTRLAGWTRTAVLVEASRPDGLSPHAAEARSTRTPPPGALCATRPPSRPWRTGRVGGRATIALGWGTEATVLRRA